MANFVRARYRHEFIVTEGFAGLLYHEGKLVETLAAGRHVRWGKNFRVALVDTRKTLLQVAGQEVLSADNVGVKLSIVLTTQIVDAAKSVQAADNHVAHIYSATQTAVRTVVAGVTMEALLTQRVAIGAQLRELDRAAGRSRRRAAPRGRSARRDAAGRTAQGFQRSAEGQAGRPGALGARPR